VHAATLPLAGLTGWQALVDVAGVQPGQRVLVHAGGGGVGHLAAVVLELVGGDYRTRPIAVLRPGGLLVTDVERTNAALAGRTTAAGRRFAGITVKPDGAGLEHLAQLIDDGHLRAHIEHAPPLRDAGKAHALLATAPPGKTVHTM